jgi:glycosyltransferase involved in cell wall biosynthesis
VRVSFVIPTRNQASFLRRCIDSCLEQRVADAEVLVVDGLSSDGTREILAGYGDRIHWTSERDSGQAEAVNKGIARARGEIIAWINSDDCYESRDVLPAVVAEFEADPRLDVVYGDATVVDAAGAVIRPYRNRVFASATELLTSPIGPSQPATFFRRELFQRIGGLREDLHWALDYELFLRMFAEARAVRHLPRTLARTTFHAGAKSIRGMHTQIREVARIKRERANAWQIALADRVRLEAGIATLHAYWAAVRLGLRRAA